MSLPREIQAALDALEPQFRQAFLEAVERVTSAAQLQAIIGHLEAGNIEAAIQALRLEPSFYAPLDRAISEAFWRGGVLALAGLPRLRDPFPGPSSHWALMAVLCVQRLGSESDPQD